MMITKETMNLLLYPTGKINLKRWGIDQGFYIEDYSYYEGSDPEVIAKGKTLKECIANYSEEEKFSIKFLFSGDISNLIIENFSLSKEDTAFIIELCEWADF